MFSSHSKAAAAAASASSGNGGGGGGGSASTGGSDFGPAIDRTNAVVERYDAISSGTIILQKELERFYLKAEASIRERVMLLDQIQANISDERRCLEVQHQECRSQISATRKLHLVLQREQTNMTETLNRAVALLDAEERGLDENIAAIDAQLKDMEQEVGAAKSKRERVDAQENELERRERQMFGNEQELDKALRELKNISEEVTERRRALEKKEGNISVWNRALDSRETDLSRCQDQFRDNLRKLEEDEKRHGLSVASSNVAPLISQRQIMDNYNMTIDREVDCEEIVLGDGIDE